MKESNIIVIAPACPWENNLLTVLMPVISCLHQQKDPPCRYNWLETSTAIYLNNNVITKDDNHYRIIDWLPAFCICVLFSVMIWLKRGLALRLWRLDLSVSRRRRYFRISWEPAGYAIVATTIIWMLVIKRHFATFLNDIKLSTCGPNSRCVTKWTT